jgi:alanine racemase
MEEQIECFKKMYYIILEYGHTPKWRHIGNSAALLKMQDTFFNAYRPGLATYGYNPLSSDDPYFEIGEKLQPALSLSSVIVALNQLEQSDIVSYNATWKNEQKQQITATVPFGYFE